MINLQPITWQNYEAIIALKVHDHQKEFVDSNERCLVKAYIDWRQHGVRSFEYGIYDGDTPIGFVMIEYRSAQRSLLEDNIPSYIIWEFMIDKHHQGKGLGRAAMEAIVAKLKTNPETNGEGDAQQIVVLYEPANMVVAKLYAALGFEDKGKRSSDGDIYVQLVY